MKFKTDYNQYNEPNVKPCERCGSQNADYVENPYAKEMYGDTEMEWLCSDCYNDIRGDI